MLANSLHVKKINRLFSKNNTHIHKHIITIITLFKRLPYYKHTNTLEVDKSPLIHKQSAKNPIQKEIVPNNISNESNKQIPTPLIYGEWYELYRQYNRLEFVLDNLYSPNLPNLSFESKDNKARFFLY